MLLKGDDNIFILKDRCDIDRIKKFMITKNLIMEYQLFYVSINTGISISNLVELKIKDLVYVKNNIICINGINYYLSENVISHFKEITDERYKGQFVFMNNSKTNRIDRSYFYKKINEASKQMNISDVIGNNTCIYTFAYHYLINTGDIKYLQYILKKSKGQIVKLLFCEEKLKVFEL